MRRRIPSALLLTALAATSAAAGAPPDASPATDYRTPRPSLVVDALAPDGDRALPLEQLEAARRQAYAMTPGVVPLFPEEPAAEMPAEGGSLRVLWAGATPDLDGDGKDDLIVSLADDASTTLRVVRGFDGAPLWSVQRADWSPDPYGIDDVDGDGIADLLAVWTDEYDSGSCEEVAEDEDWCWRSTWTTMLELRSGIDGSLLLTRELAGSSTHADGFYYESDGSLLGQERHRSLRRYEAIAAFPWVLPSSDHDGDGVTDLVSLTVSVFDLDSYEYESDAISSSSRSELRYVGTAEGAVIDSSGASIWELPAEAADRRSWMLPAGDLDGDDRGDLVVVSRGEVDQTRSCESTLVLGECHESDASDDAEVYLRTYSGVDQEVLWETDSTETPLLSHGTVYPVRADLDLDGADDLALDAAALSGRDGSTLWSYPDAWVLDPLGADASGAFTFLARSTDHGPDGCLPGDRAGTETLTLTRVSGADGSDLFETQHTAGDCQTYGYVQAYLTGDLDGDGLSDLEVVAYEEVGDQGWLRPDSQRFETAAAGDLSPDFVKDGYVRVVPDLDGDGADDVLVVRGDALVALADLGRTELWLSTDLGAAELWDYSIVGDLDGDGAHDLAVRERNEDGDFRVAFRRGTDLGLLWAGATRKLVWETTTVSDAR